MRPLEPWMPEGAPVLVVGDSMLDVYVFGSVERISPEAPVPVVKQEEMVEIGGGAANVAINVVAMGGTPHLISCVGADAEADRLAAVLSQAGMTFDLVTVAGKPTTVKTRFLARHSQLLRLDREVPTEIPPPCEDQVLAAVEAKLDWCRLIILSDYSKGIFTDRVLAGILSLAQARGVPTVVDPKRRSFAAYRGATYIKPNRSELETATGLRAAADRDIERAAAVLTAETGASILVTRSEHGMSLVHPSGAATHMPTHAREVIDVTGAGDTAVAAFSLGLASGYAAEEAMSFANLAAGIAVVKQGTATASADEIESERLSLVGGARVPKGALVTRETAIRLRQQWKRQGLVVGFTNGCFDLLHPGHVALLRGTARWCDRLIVGLNSDASVRRLKGESRPVQTEVARAAVLGAIDQVDLVVIFEEDTPAQLIGDLVPDVLTKGADYRVDEIVGAELVRAAGGRVMTIDLLPGHSTTGLVNKR
jgi:D-beta-D-heptose 7-phosphate kinase / D-beta-D-heptose 1-phosphate adenosyltransferase